jgi:hypothetical protein
MTIYELLDDRQMYCCAHLLQFISNKRGLKDRFLIESVFQYLINSAKRMPKPEGKGKREWPGERWKQLFFSDAIRHLSNESVYGSPEVNHLILDSCPLMENQDPDESPWVRERLNRVTQPFPEYDGTSRFGDRPHRGWYGWRYKLGGCLQKGPEGRPKKYGDVLAALPATDLFSPASIAEFAETKGMLEACDPSELHLEKQRIRISMGRYSNYRGFHNDGDGTVNKNGQPPIPAWRGWRWQMAAFIGGVCHVESAHKP